MDTEDPNAPPADGNATNSSSPEISVLGVGEADRPAPPPQKAEKEDQDPRVDGVPVLESSLGSTAASNQLASASVENEDDAIRELFGAYQRLIGLGWRSIIYCPKDGTWFDAIEAGSTGIHECQYQGEWPNGHWWIAADHDLWPSHPILFRLREKP